MKPKLVRITTPYFVAGVEVGVRSAPIIKYMHDWTIVRIVRHCEVKGWDCEVLGLRKTLRLYGVYMFKGNYNNENNNDLPFCK